MSDRAAIIGPCQMVQPLRNSGIDVFGCDSALKAQDTLEKVHGMNKYSVIFMTERMAEECLGKVAELEEKVNIVLIPDHRGSTGMFKKRLDDLIRQATGALNV
jgi:vacuolar-type H+-ATPase subunit F/Vma7